MYLTEEKQDIKKTVISVKQIDSFASQVKARHFTLISDEKPWNGGKNRGPSPLEYIMTGLGAWLNISTARLAEKIRFQYHDLHIEAEGHLDRRGRKGNANVPVHFKYVRVFVKIKTDEIETKLNRLITMVEKYCPVDSLFKVALPDYKIIWERISWAV